MPGLNLLLGMIRCGIKVSSTIEYLYPKKKELMRYYVSIIVVNFIN